MERDIRMQGSNVCKRFEEKTVSLLAAAEVDHSAAG
jgi:hypothetical protein